MSSTCGPGPGSPTRWTPPGECSRGRTSPVSTGPGSSRTASRCWSASPPAGPPPDGAGASGAGAGPVAPTGPLSLSTATAEQLETLPGVGPVLAQHIVDYRVEHGGYGSVDELREVTGIGDRRFDDLQPLVRP
ncbi:ComEA family DNA-binding protein [Streptomyces sp. AM 2-1-1]|uniref:ComEA family DNA-binding protein n=1 Tax=Streptomyces sp. AM 2-1-1 TaxID=3028709 RepID=UPI0031BAE4F6